MADHAFSTSLSRRTILSVAAASLAPAAEFGRLQAASGSPDTDARLLHRLSRTTRLRAAWLAAREEAGELLMKTYRHPDFSRPRGLSRAGCAEFDALAARTGYRAAADRAVRLHGLYAAAGGRAFALPAGTVPGLAAKLRLAAAWTRENAERVGVDDEPDWFAPALADLERWSRLAIGDIAGRPRMTDG